jgi:coproporphyrinogen III oxidase-like Fe-S oxidoreductase
VGGERRLAAHEIAAEALFTGLRRRDGIDLAAFRERHDLDPCAEWREGLEAAESAGLVIRAAGRLRLTGRGMLLSNEIFQGFV